MNTTKLSLDLGDIAYNLQYVILLVLYHTASWTRWLPRLLSRAHSDCPFVACPTLTRRSSPRCWQRIISLLRDHLILAAAPHPHLNLTESADSLAAIPQCVLVSRFA